MPPEDEPASAVPEAATLPGSSEPGVVSAISGGLSVILAIVASQLELLRHPRSGHALHLAQRFGVVHEPEIGDVPEISNTTLLTITDARLIAALAMVGAGLAVTAICCALWAEHREEDSLYLSVGLLCGGAALCLLHPVVGAVVLASGTAAILRMRRRPD